MILQKSLNEQYNGKWILILILANKSYYLAEKQVPNHTHHWILMTIPFTKLNPKNILFLDPKLSFDDHLQCILIKSRKIIRLIRKLQPIIPRAALWPIHKSFLRPHLDYGDVIYGQVFNESFQSNLKSVQYNSALTITGATPLFINNQKFKQSTRKSLICLTISKQFSGANKKRKSNNPLRE